MPRTMEDLRVEASPGSMLRISSPRGLMLSSPHAATDLEKLTKDAETLSEDLDELRAKIKGMALPKPEWSASRCSFLSHEKDLFISFP